jgi:MFS family permease
LPESLHHSSRSGRAVLWDRQAWLAVLARPSIGLLLLTSFFAVSAFASYESTLALAVEHLSRLEAEGAADSGVLQAVRAWVRRLGYTQSSDVRLAIVFGTFTYLGLVLTLSQGVLVRRIAGRVSEGRLAVSGTLVAAVGYVLSSVAVQRVNYGLFCLAMAVAVIGFSLITPAVQSLISRRTSARRQGHVLGVAQSVSSLARIVGPVAGVRLFAHAAAWPFWTVAAVMGGTVLLVASAVRGGADHPDA